MLCDGHRSSVGRLVSRSQQGNLPALEDQTNMHSPGHGQSGSELVLLLTRLNTNSCRSRTSTAFKGNALNNLFWQQTKLF